MSFTMGYKPKTLVFPALYPISTYDSDNDLYYGAVNAKSGVLVLTTVSIAAGITASVYVFNRHIKTEDSMVVVTLTQNYEDLICYVTDIEPNANWGPGGGLFGVKIKNISGVDLIGPIRIAFKIVDLD